MSPILNLGYLEFEVADLDEWERFTRQTLGLPTTREGDTLAVRLDRRQPRLRVVRGTTDDLRAAGWETESRADVEIVARKARDWGLAVHAASEAEARARNVDYLVSFTDPLGNRIEVCCGLETAATPLSLPHLPKGFKTDPLGLGHYVLLARDKAKTLAFYREVMGMKLSDAIVMSLGSLGNLDATFLHSSPRHHSIAVASVPDAIPLPRRLDHFMLEVHEMDDVGALHKRFIKDQQAIVREFGKHPNDLMFSFYGLTPSGFHLEIGCDGVEIDDAHWTPVTYDHISLWGHISPPAPSD